MADVGMSRAMTCRQTISIPMRIKSARYLEPMATLLISLGYGLKMGMNIGFKLVKG